jgi:hypothetical protein
MIKCPSVANSCQRKRNQQKSARRHILEADES